MPVKNNAAIKASAIKKLGIKSFHVADYLTTPEMIDGFLNEVIALGDPAAIPHALGTAARARGMTRVAKATGLSRENLYRSLSGAHNANFSTVMLVADALGFELTLKPKKVRASLADHVKGITPRTGTPRSRRRRFRSASGSEPPERRYLPAGAYRAGDLSPMTRPAEKLGVIRPKDIGRPRTAAQSIGRPGTLGERGGPKPGIFMGSSPLIRAFPGQRSTPVGAVRAAAASRANDAL